MAYCAAEPVRSDEAPPLPRKQDGSSRQKAFGQFVALLAVPAVSSRIVPLCRILNWWASLRAQPAKVGVEGSNPFARSKFLQVIQRGKVSHAGLLLLRAVLGACILSRFYAPGRKLSDKTSQARRHICPIRSASRQDRQSSELPYKTRNVKRSFERSAMRLSAAIPASMFPADSKMKSFPMIAAGVQQPGGKPFAIRRSMIANELKTVRE